MSVLPSLVATEEKPNENGSQFYAGRPSHSSKSSAVNVMK